MTAREHAEKASQLLRGADEMRVNGYQMRGRATNEGDRFTADYFKDAGRQERAANAHAMVALALAATDVTTGKATVKRRLT